MPQRKARSSVVQPAKKNTSKQSRKRQLDAFAIAGKIVPEKSKIRRHRLGEVDDDQPRKRRRPDDEEDEEEEEETGRQDKRARKQGDEDIEYGSDSEGNEWTIGAVDDDDDESLDSDEAFGESDEERFEGFTFRGSSGNKPQSKSKSGRASQQPQNEDGIDLDEGAAEDASDEDDFGEDGVDLATMLDDVQSEEDEDEADEDEQSSEEEEADSSDDEQRHARLQDFVEGLGSSSKGKSIAKVDTEEALTLEDLLEDADLDSKTLATLRPKKKLAPELVTSTLPKRQQDAIDRKLATQKAKEQLDRWRDTVIQNRRADFLSFPLQRPDEDELPHRDTFAPTQQFRPTTELEANIRQIMEESGMVTKSVGNGVVEEGEQDLLKAEELAANKLPVEEVLQRRAELRRMRELLFREEIKAKRIAKIKSKAYRRVHRKERERLADKERMLMDPESFANGELNEDEQEEADRRRAEARMSAKHKDSKWARSLKATDRAVWDDDARAGVIEQARRQEELKRRIAGRNVDQELSDDSDDEENNDYDGDTTAQLRKLASNKDEPKGLAALKFMQTAENRRKAQNNAAIADLQRELDPTAQDDDSGIEDNGLGRAIFGPKPTVPKVAKPIVKRHELEEGVVSDDEAQDNGAQEDEPTTQRPAKIQEKTSTKAKKASGPLAAACANTIDEEQPSSTSAWLTAPRGKKSKLDRKLARGNDTEAVIDTRIEVNGNAASQPDVQQAANEKSIGNTDGWTSVTYKQDSEADAGETTHDPMLSKAERNAAFHARAFAGDDVAVHFSAEKDALAASEDEKEISTEMPGWGTWGGAGLTKSKRKAAERARHNPLYKTKVAGTKPQDRKDAKLENVIISEKSDRKGKKYLAPILPHQYERKEEYERSLRMPLGPEWTTKEVFQKNTRPRVVVKPGTIIEPMSRPLV